MTIVQIHTNTAAGVLPDDVIRDPRSDAELIYIRFRASPDRVVVEEFLKRVTDLVDELTDGGQPEQAASICVGFGQRLFENLGVGPIGLIAPEPVGPGDQIVADMVVYAMFREEWKIAEFRRSLALAGSGLLESVVSQRGFQRPDAKELGGFHDGLRNASDNRPAVVFVDRDRFPEEPEASSGGTYMVTMRIPQNLDAWDALPEVEQEQIIGRRKSDGSRLDLEEGASADEEPVIGTGCPLNSHVAKSGPRGEHRDGVQIFRRGVPYTDWTPDGTVSAGLLFVSFQASVDQFRTVFGEWIDNADFPMPGTGKDALFERGFASIESTGLFFVPAPAEFLGAQFFDPPESDDRCHGRVVVRKQLADAAGNPILSERGGFVFQLADEAGADVGEPFVTDSTGRALSPGVPTGESYILRELSGRDGFQLAPDQSVVLDRRRMLIEVTNTSIDANVPYGR